MGQIPNRHRIRKSSYTTEIKLGLIDVEVIYSGYPDHPMVESVIWHLGKNQVDLIDFLESEEIEELARQCANNEADKTDMAYESWREAEAEKRLTGDD